MKRIITVAVVLLSGALSQCVSFESDRLTGRPTGCDPRVQTPGGTGAIGRRAGSGVLAGEGIICEPVYSYPVRIGMPRQDYGRSPANVRPAPGHRHHNPFHVPAGRYKHSTTPGKWRL